MDFALNFLNMSLPFEVENGSNISYIYEPVNNTLMTSPADGNHVCDSVILGMLVVLMLWRSDWIKMI